MLHTLQQVRFLFREARLTREILNKHRVLIIHPFVNSFTQPGFTRHILNRNDVRPKVVLRVVRVLAVVVKAITSAASATTAIVVVPTATVAVVVSTLLRLLLLVALLRFVPLLTKVLPRPVAAVQIQVDILLPLRLSLYFG